MKSHSSFCRPILLLQLAVGIAAAQPDADRVTQVEGRLQQVGPKLGPPPASGESSPPKLNELWWTDIRLRRQEANRRDVTAWRQVGSKENFTKFAETRIAALKNSLGIFPEPPLSIVPRITRLFDGDGFTIECAVYESRPGLFVTANLYAPKPLRASMPGMLICHSHHNPKSQSELQHMGMTWARQGCIVLIPDQLGHGERRQHPFRTAGDWPGSFKVSRQDYYFRYNLGMQLHLMGDSLVGWMAWDMMRGVDLLLERPGIDPKRILLLGSVAGGGDPVAVTAALDLRIDCAVPFNFGGPQPEAALPLPGDSELSFNYIGGGSWESTRNLRLSARDGFLPWVIVGSRVPRPLIYAHEFSWDRDHDPVWKRLETIYGWQNAADKLAATHGWGRVTMSSTEASHCNNIGAPHRKAIHEAVARWYGIPVPSPEYLVHRDASELSCLEGSANAAGVRLTPVHQLASQEANKRTTAFRSELDRLPVESRRERLRAAWSRQLGLPNALPQPRFQRAAIAAPPVRELCGWVTTERSIIVPVLVLLPDLPATARCPLVVAVAKDGKGGFLKHRRQELASLLAMGVAVCLPDLRGTGETSPDEDRGRNSAATAFSASEQMLGSTAIGGKLTDLLTILRWLRSRNEIDAARIAVWGESFAPTNPVDRAIEAPLDADPAPALAEPAGPLLALLAGLFDDQIRAVLGRGGLVSFRSVLDSPFVHVPHDVIVPSACSIGDLCDIAAAVAPRPVRLGSLVTGLNRAATPDVVLADWPAPRRDKSLEIATARDDLAAWLEEKLRPQ